MGGEEEMQEEGRGVLRMIASKKRKRIQEEVEEARREGDMRRMWNALKAVGGKREGSEEADGGGG